MASPRIFLFDDNPADRAIVAHEMRAHLGKCTLIEPRDKGEFAAALGTNEPDLVVTDFRLGWTDGLTILRAIKSRWADCPVIMFTGTGDENAAVEGMKLGLDDYVTKEPSQRKRLGPGAKTALANAQRWKEFRRAEASRLQFLSAVEAAPDLVAAITPDGKLLYMNRAGRDLLGVPQDQDLSGVPIWSFYPAQDAASLIAHALPAAMDKGVWRGSSVLLSRDGSRTPVSQLMVAQRSPAGRVERLSVLTRDISEIAQVQEAQGEDRLLLEGIVNSAQDAIITVDENRRIVLFNAAAEEVFRCPVTDALGESLDRFIPPGAAQTGPDPAAALGIGGPESRRHRLITFTGRRADGEEFPFEASVSQLGLVDRKMFAVILRDITRRRELESQLLQAQKMEAFGLLASGIAHDFNNIISLVIGYSDLLMREGCCQAAGRGYVQQVNDAGRRAAALTRQLLTFSRKETMQFHGESLNGIVSNLARMLERIIGEHIVLELRLDRSEPAVRADAAMVEQVLMNLAVNARDAMRRGGRLTLETVALQVGAAQALRHGREPGPYAALKVSDTGAGMRPDVMERIFEPFFTTKARGKGTGLGLSTVQHIMREHSGWVEVASAAGAGAMFTVYFPRVAAETPAHPPAADADIPGGGGRASILVVEDETPVRELVTRVLVKQGHTVVEADSADAALRMWEEHRDDLDLLLTDIVLPGGMSGRELATQFQRQRPELKVLYMSGYVNDATDREFMRKAQRQFLQKPFSLEQILGLVGECLREPAGRAPV